MNMIDVMNKRKAVVVFFTAVFLSVFLFCIPVHAFTGNEPNTQTIIVTSQVVDSDGKLIDPDSNAEENSDPFFITVHFSNLPAGTAIFYADKTLTPDQNGVAETSYQTENCEPMYFDNVPIEASVSVTERRSKYQTSCRTSYFACNYITPGADRAVTTPELRLRDGKDGFVLFTNQKAVKQMHMKQPETKDDNWILVLLLIAYMAGLFVLTI